MKRYIVCIVVVLIACVAQVNAVNYKSTYRGRSQQPAYMAPATVPVVTFHSTSAYSGQWAPQESTTPMLNSDGTVNDGAYMGSPKRPGSIRRTESNINNPGDPDDDEDEGNVPLGDGLWVLLLLAGAYILARTLRTKRAITK